MNDRYDFQVKNQNRVAEEIVSAETRQIYHRVRTVVLPEEIKGITTLLIINLDSWYLLLA